jgi:hypothetical protein
MRRLIGLLACACVMSVLAGCNLYHWHGVCDCQYDDYCSSRAPWVRQGGAVAPTTEYVSPTPGNIESIPAPLPAKLPQSKLPDAKSKL